MTKTLVPPTLRVYSAVFEDYNMCFFHLIDSNDDDDNNNNINNFDEADFIGKIGLFVAAKRHDAT